MNKVDPVGGGAHALTDFPNVPGVITPEQQTNLEHLAQLVPLWFNWSPKVGPVGRKGKAPINPRTGHMGAVDDPKTAGSLADALGNIPKGGGIGVLLSDAPHDLVCLDLDHVIRAGEFHWLGAQAVELFKGAYVEVSPSGTGLRIFALGVVPWADPEVKIIGPVKVGAWPDGEAVKFEVYHHQPHKWVRCTGAVLSGSACRVSAAQDGIDWVLSMVRAVKAAGGGSNPVNAKVQGIDAVFDQLEKLRGSPDKDSAVIVEEITGKVSSQPRSKLADAWNGKGDRSQADYAVCCEAIRRGAGNPEAVLEVWSGAPASDREKFGRSDYQSGTVLRAARAVLADPPKSWGAGTGAGRVPVALSQTVADAIAASSDTLTRSKSGQLSAEVGNVVVLFRHDPALSGMVAFNELSQKTVRLKSWKTFDSGASDQPGAITDDDLTRLQMWLSQTCGLKLDHKDVARGIDAAGRDAAFDPLASKLQELGKAWDKTPRLHSWLTTYARVDATGCADFVSAAGVCFMVGAVARALSPGCKHDTVLAVEGSGGGGKSTMFKVLADAVAPDLFTDGVHDISNTASLVEATVGRWIVEIAELAGIRRAADVEALKAAITRQSDTHRRAYEVYPREYARRIVFVATTNRSEYLADPSGALLRRFWSVRTRATEQDPIDQAALAAVARQLWGEAVCLHRGGRKWYIAESDGAAYHQWVGGREARREDGAFHDEIVDFLISDGLVYPGLLMGMPIKQIAKQVGDMRTVEGDQASLGRLADSLRAAGLVNRKVGGKKLWFLGAGTAPKVERWKLERAKACA